MARVWASPGLGLMRSTVAVVEARSSSSTNANWQGFAGEESNFTAGGRD